jgi:hypothetical protein
MNKIITILLISTALLLQACQKNIDMFVPDTAQGNGPDTSWNNTIASTAPVFSLQTNLRFEPFTDSIEVNSNSVTIISASGLQCTFPPNCCVNAAGQAVTGKVYVDLQLIKKKGDMILMNKPTTSNGALLVSGGEFFISLKKDGKELQLAPNAKVHIKYTDVPVNTAMKLFYGEEPAPGRFNWVPNTDTANFIAAGQQVYEITTTRLRWINCDYFYDTAGINRTVVATQLPSSYTNANTTVFLAFKDFRSVLGMYADVPERRFVSGKVPAGKLAVVVAISKQGNDYFLGKETITTGLNVTTNVHKVMLNPVKTSLADIRAYLATL